MNVQLKIAAIFLAFGMILGGGIAVAWHAASPPATATATHAAPTVHATATAPAPSPTATAPTAAASTPKGIVARIWDWVTGVIRTLLTGG